MDIEAFSADISSPVTFPRSPHEWKLAGRTLTGIPVEDFPAIWTATCSVLPFKPYFYPLLFHVLRFFNQAGVVGNVIDDMSVQKTQEAGTRKFGTLEAPGDLFLLSTPAKAMTAISAGRKYVVGEASITTDFF